MRQIPKLLDLALLVFYLPACNRSSVKLIYTTAKGEIEPVQNLVFTFDKPLVSDTVSGSWDSTEYIRFTPAIKGRFRWEKPDQLVFFAGDAIHASHRIRGRITI